MIIRSMGNNVDCLRVRAALRPVTKLMPVVAVAASASACSDAAVGTAVVSTLLGIGFVLGRAIYREFSAASQAIDTSARQNRESEKDIYRNFALLLDRDPIAAEQWLRQVEEYEKGLPEGGSQRKAATKVRENFVIMFEKWKTATASAVIDAILTQTENIVAMLYQRFSALAINDPSAARSLLESIRRLEEQYPIGSDTRVFAERVRTNLEEILEEVTAAAPS